MNSPDVSLWIENGKNNLPLIIPVGISLLGGFLNFIGVCLKQSSLTNYSKNPYALDWYLMFFYFFVSFSLLLMIAMNAVAKYRLALIGLITLALSYIPAVMDRDLSGLSLLSAVSDAENATIKAGLGLGVAGAMFIVLPYFFILVWLGMEDDAALKVMLSPSESEGRSPVIVQVGRREKEIDESTV